MSVWREAGWSSSISAELSAAVAGRRGGGGGEVRGRQEREEGEERKDFEADPNGVRQLV